MIIGDRAVAPTLQADYTATFSGDCNAGVVTVTANSPVSLTCTVTNTARAARTITINKVIVGGSSPLKLISPC